MFGERTGVDTVGEIWDRFFRVLPNISHISEGRWVGVSYHGDAPDGYS
ncbi:MAG TPA: AraC family transcriptional regulator, partial [Lachnoclostridium sp.]|nr:AraC family transcriptional regulator [Lachnoclostridium sp.]